MTAPQKSYKVRGGFITVPIVCPRTAASACEGAVSLRYRGYRLGGGEFVTDSGDRDPVLIALTKRGKTYTRNGKRIRAKLYVTAKDSAGKKASFNRTVTLVGPKPKAAAKKK